ncbi:hypothetical protein C0W92_03955 [Photobacterium angustum]|uniref:hypothetical protein n=1 Tax=Photobacterium angustum TaxID=661 RepID=UPI0005E1B101|nr:hypothetical protein [Photobacterium angustum]KJG27147.1 hypothetical protein UA69_20520 [Photobacterium angustum]PSW92139.1 hypothetical protein C0W92_03955 [Photobacterium angustum]
MNKTLYYMLLLFTFIITGCLSSSPSEEENQSVTTDNDTVNSVQPPVFFPVKETDDTNDGNNESEVEIDTVNDNTLDKQDSERFPTLDAKSVTFSGNITTIPVTITNPISESIYVNVYRDYSTDIDGNFIVNQSDRIIATAVVEENYEGELFITPDINKLLIEIIELNNNQIINQQEIAFPIESINL